MLPIFGNQLLWRYFSVLGPITQMGKNGSLALAGAALGEPSAVVVLSGSMVLISCGFHSNVCCRVQPTPPSVC